MHLLILLRDQALIHCFELNQENQYENEAYFSQAKEIETQTRQEYSMNHTPTI